MTFLLFLIVVVLVVVLLSRPKAPKVDNYQQGYWDGYRALGTKVQRQLDNPSGELDRSALQAAVTVGITGVEEVAPPLPIQSAGEVPIQQPASMLHTSTQPGLASAAATTAPQPTVTLPQASTLQTPEAKSLRNLNVILYVASFLLVAAGALFVGGTMPDGVKLVGVWLIIAAFYIGGYILYRKSPKVRPAAMAFLGTGLALIPFAGIALHQYTSMGASTAWLLTSIIGVVVYLFTAVRLQNQLVSYLAMAFVLSLVMAGPASASLGILWQFVVLIMVALCATMIAILKPRWVPAVFSRPIEDMGQVVTPLVLVASFFVGGDLQLVGYKIVFSVATAYYVVALLQSRSLLHETALRIVAFMTAMLFIFDVPGISATTVGLLMLGVTVIQAVYSLWRVSAVGHYLTERIWIMTLFVVQLLSMVIWYKDEQGALLNTIGFLVIGLTSLAATLRFRQAWFGIAGVLASFILPYIVARDLIDPALPLNVLSIWFVIAAIATFVGTYLCRQRSSAILGLLTVAYAGYVLLGLSVAFSYGSLGFSTSILAVFTVLLAVTAYALGWVRALIPASLLLFITLGCGWTYFKLDTEWGVFGVTWIGAGLLYVGSWMTAILRKQLVLHRLSLVILAAGALGLGGLVKVFDGDTTIAIFGSLTLIVMAAIVATEGFRYKRYGLVEASVYVATLSLQRCVALALPDLNALFYGHWWAFTIAGATYLYASRTMTRLIVGLVIMSGISGIYALSEGGGYQLLFLIEHVGLLTFGALRSKSWALWWGLAGSVLAVVYFLGGLNFLSLAFLGLLLIGIVVWRLLRQRSVDSE